MTATYDGRLAVTKDGISPCCRAMDICAMRRQIYVSTKGQMMLRSTEDPKKGMAMMCCPFCGAQEGCRWSHSAPSSPSSGSVP